MNEAIDCSKNNNDRYFAQYQELVVEDIQERVHKGLYLIKNEDDSILSRKYHSLTANIDLLLKNNAKGIVMYLETLDKYLAISTELILLFIKKYPSHVHNQWSEKDNKNERRPRVPVHWFSVVDKVNDDYFKVVEYSANSISEIFENKKYKRNDQD
jgi:hypothetical protein